MLGHTISAPKAVSSAFNAIFITGTPSFPIASSSFAPLTSTQRAAWARHETTSVVNSVVIDSRLRDVPSMSISQSSSPSSHR